MTSNPMRAAWLCTPLFLMLAPAADRRPPRRRQPPSRRRHRIRGREFAARFIEDYLRANPFFAVQAGRHEYDGQMPDCSAAGIAAEVARLQQGARRGAGVRCRRASARTSDSSARSLLGVHRRAICSGWSGRAFPFTNPAWYLDRLDPDVYLNRDYAPLAKRLQGYIGYARAHPEARRRDPRQPAYPAAGRASCERGIDGFGGFADFFRHDVPKVFAPVQDPAAQKDLAAADAAAAQAMDGLQDLARGRARARERRLRARRAAVPRDAARATERSRCRSRSCSRSARPTSSATPQALKAACAQYLPRGHAAGVRRPDAGRQAARLARSRAPARS